MLPLKCSRCSVWPDETHFYTGCPAEMVVSPPPTGQAWKTKNSTRATWPSGDVIHGWLSTSAAVYLQIVEVAAVCRIRTIECPNNNRRRVTSSAAKQREPMAPPRVPPRRVEHEQAVDQVLRLVRDLNPRRRHHRRRFRHRARARAHATTSATQRAHSTSGGRENTTPGREYTTTVVVARCRRTTRIVCDWSLAPCPSRARGIGTRRA